MNENNCSGSIGFVGEVGTYCLIKMLMHTYLRETELQHARIANVTRLPISTDLFPNQQVKCSYWITTAP